MIFAFDLSAFGFDPNAFAFGFDPNAFAFAFDSDAVHLNLHLIRLLHLHLHLNAPPRL